MKITMIPISQIIPYARNPRKNDKAVGPVMESIKEFGFKVPIVIDSKNIIVAGHTRYKAATRLKLQTVPCIIADGLTEEQIKAFRIADNKVGEIAEWNLDLLNLELADIEMDMNLFGFAPLNGDSDNILDDEQFDPTPPTEPKSKPGQIYQLGRHRVMCGDAEVTDHLTSLMSGARADLLLTDPPYNVGYEGKTEDKLTIQNDKITDSQFYSFLSWTLANVSGFIKPGGSFYVFHADSKSEVFRRSIRESIGEIRQCLIWVKNQFVMGRQDCQWKHEPILYGWKDGAAHYFTNDRTQSTILECDKSTRNGEHPTMKPIPLLAKLIKNSTWQPQRETDPNGNITTQGSPLVLDPFGGSGSTLIAAEQTGRTCYTMEIDPRYVDVIISRWEQFTGQKAVLVEGESG